MEVSLEDGNKAAVFLMDAQGMFDPDISTEEQKMLGAITFLISSKQFFHQKLEIETVHLDSIYDCAKLAEEIRNKDHVCNNLQKQSLTCVVHDWETDGYEIGFNGGKKHLEDVTDGTARRAIEHKLRKEYFDKIFGEIACFLLPPPKKAVRRMNEAPRTLLVKEFGQNFLTTLDELLKHEFLSNQLMLKQIDGKSMTCKQLCDHFTLHAESINSREQLQECLEHDRVRKAAFEMDGLIEDILKDDFVEILWKKLCEKRKDENTHQAIFDLFYSDAIDKFDCKRKSKVKAFVNKYKNVLKLLLQKIFATLKEGLQAEELYWQAMDEFKEILKKVKPEHRLMNKSDIRKAEKQLEEKAQKLKKVVANINPDMSEQIYGYFCDAGTKAIREADAEQENKIKRRAAIGLAVAGGVASIAFFPLDFIPGQISTFIAIGSAASGLFGLAGGAAAESVDKNYRSEDQRETIRVTLESDLSISLNFGLVKVPM